MAARTLPGLGMKAFFALGEDGWNDEFDTNTLQASVLIQAQAKSAVAATPGAPADGDIHMFTNAHPTQANKLAIRDNGGWVYWTPREGWMVYNLATDSYWKFDGAVWVEIKNAAYPVGFFFVAAPVASEVLLLHTFPRSVTFADDFASSVGKCGTNPAANFILTVKKNGVGVGSITISNVGAFTFVTTGGTVTYDTGDVLEITAQAGVDTAAKVSITLLGA